MPQRSRQAMSFSAMVLPRAPAAQRARQRRAGAHPAIPAHRRARRSGFAQEAGHVRTLPRHRAPYSMRTFGASCAPARTVTCGVAGWWEGERVGRCPFNPTASLGQGDVRGSGVVGGRARRAWMGLAGVVCAGEAEANYGWLPKRSPSHNPAKGDRGNLISHVTLQRQSHGTFQSRRSRARASPMGRRKRRPNPFFRLTRTAPCAPRPPSSSLRSRGSGSCARSLGQSNQTSRPMCGNTASLVAMTARSTEFSGS